MPTPDAARHPRAAPGSVEFHQRYAESLDHLFNHLNFFGRGAVLFDAILRAGLDRPARCAAPAARLHRRRSAGRALNVLPRRPGTAARPGRRRPPAVGDRAGARLHRRRPQLPALAGRRRRGSLDALRRRTGFTDDQPPTALLYLLLRHALILGYCRLRPRAAPDGRLRRGRAARAAARARVRARRHRRRQQREPLGAAVQATPAIVGGAGTVAEHIAARPRHRDGDRARCASRSRRSSCSPTRRRRGSSARSPSTSTAAAYRFDAWLLGLVHLQLETMRDRRRGPTLEAASTSARTAGSRTSRPQPRELTPVQLPRRPRARCSAATSARR